MQIYRNKGKSLHHQEINFLALKELIDFLAGMLFCFTISPDLVMFLQRTVSFKCSSI